MQSSYKKYSTLLTKYFKPYWKQALGLSVLLLSGVVLRLINPQLLKDFIDTVVSKGPGQTLVNRAFQYLVLAILIQLITVSETFVAANIGLLATNRLRTDLTSHCLNLDLSFHQQHAPGEMIERVDGDVGTLGNFFSSFIVEILGSIVLLFGILFVLFRIDWRVGGTFSIFVILTLGVISLLKDVAVPAYKTARQSSAKLFGYLEERLSGTEDVRANGAVAYVMRRFYERSRPVLSSWLRATIIGVGAFSSSFVLFALGSALSLGLGAYLYIKGEITIGTVYLIFRYAELLKLPLENITRQFQDLQQAGASAVRILDLLGLRSSVHDNGETILHFNKDLSVHCDQVSFAYQDDRDLLVEGIKSKEKVTQDGLIDKSNVSLTENVLTEISFTLPPGKILGLLGRTGSGKTTLTRLLLRFYDPQKGMLYLDGVPLTEIPLAFLRGRIGLVTQEVQLFNDSLRHNLTLFDPTIADERILNAFEQLGLMDWYRSLPDHLETKLDPGGSRLSAGEAQLLALVRVFLRDPGLIILDEASSRLDPATEARLERAIQRLLSGRTAMIIAHRLATVQRADYIMILENGRQVEYGEREKLAEDLNSLFAHLLNTDLKEVLV